MILLRLLLAFLLPPAGLHLAAAPRNAIIVVSALWVVGQAVFWGFMAGPGFMLALLASLTAMVIVVRTIRGGRA